MSEYFKSRQLIAQGLKAPETKKAPGGPKKPKAEGDEKQELSLTEWFLERRKEMTGKCKHCGAVSCKNDNLFFKHSIAHILPKRLFPSVATHPDNWIELCFWSKNCHGNFDNGILDMIDLHCFDEVIEKFIRIYPAIDNKERRHIPDILLQYVQSAN